MPTEPHLNNAALMERRRAAIPRGVSVDAALASVDLIFKNDVEASRVAAIIVEPVQGDGGFNVAPPEFLQRLRALCDQPGILLIVDEIQTGAGRTGTWFAIDQSGVEPDLITLAKSMAGGFLLLSCGTNGNVIRILVPLTASDSIVDEGLAIMDASLTAIQL